LHDTGHLQAVTGYSKTVHIQALSYKSYWGYTHRNFEMSKHANMMGVNTTHSC